MWRVELLAQSRKSRGGSKRRTPSVGRGGRHHGDHKSTIHPDIPNKPGVSNWVQDTGHLPHYMKRVAKHIRADSGYSTSRAIAAAVSQTKKRAATNPQAAAAVARWEAQKAASGGGGRDKVGGSRKRKVTSSRGAKSGRGSSSGKSGRSAAPPMW